MELGKVGVGDKIRKSVEVTPETSLQFDLERAIIFMYA